MIQNLEEPTEMLFKHWSYNLSLGLSRFRALDEATKVCAPIPNYLIDVVDKFRTAVRTMDECATKSGLDAVVPFLLARQSLAETMQAHPKVFPAHTVLRMQACQGMITAEILDKICIPMGPPISTHRDYIDLLSSVKIRGKDEIDDLLSAGGNVCELLAAVVFKVDETCWHLKVIDTRWKAGTAPGESREIERVVDHSPVYNVFCNEFSGLIETLARYIHPKVSLSPDACSVLWYDLCVFYKVRSGIEDVEEKMGKQYDIFRSLANWVHGYWMVEQSTHHFTVPPDTFFGTGLPPVPPAI